MTEREAGSTRDWPELDARHVWHPYTQMLTAPPPIAVERAEGAWLYLADGRRVLDAIASWWPRFTATHIPRSRRRSRSRPRGWSR